MEDTKKCSLCQETKATTDFHKRTGGGFQSRCKQCRNSLSRLSYKQKTNPEPEPEPEPEPSPDPSKVPIPTTLLKPKQQNDEPQHKKAVTFFNSNGGKRILVKTGKPYEATTSKDYIEKYKNDPNMTQVGSDFESDDDFSILTVRSGNNWRKLRLRKTKQD